MFADIGVLYGRLQEINQLKSNHYWVQAAKLMKLPNLRSISPYDYPREDYPNYIASFLGRNRLAAIFPMSFFNIVSGFGFRSLSTKEFSLVKRYSFTCYTTWTAWERWKAGAFTWGTPILLAEDVVSAEVFAMLYPWAMAYLRSAVSENLAHLLSLFTDRVLLAPDRDKAGEKGFESSKRALKSRGVSVYRIDVQRRYNDAGDIFKAALRGKNTRNDTEGLKNLISSLIR